ncbi:MAG: ester cyclase [bacterium]
MSEARFILYVNDQRTSSSFYAEVLGISPDLDVPGMTEFALPGGGALGLMPTAGIKRLLGEPLPDPTLALGIPRAELYLPVTDPRAALRRAVGAGATLLSEVTSRDWGDAAGYCLDPDGHVLAFARQLEDDSMDARERLARRWFDEVINERDLDAITEIYSSDYVHHGPAGAEIRGLENVRDFAAAILAASDDRRATVLQQVAEGDLVVTRFVSRGHHTGVFRGVEPSGNAWTTEGIVISRIENGRIVEDWEIVHQSGFQPSGGE